MPTRPSSVVVLRHPADLGPDGDGGTDWELLARFLRSRDEDALADLVRRHAPMVWGVCRRLLHHHDAEDAFQATFLVLARKAADVPREAVANWLYGVARQTAVRLRATAAKRGRRETQAATMPEPTVPEVRDADLQRAVDEELSRLPDHYRGVVVLCDLEGMTRKEAARQLGIPEGSVASRLARARAMLAKRLNRPGIMFTGSVAALLSAESASASAPPALVASTIKAASLPAAGQAAGVVSAKVAALTEGVMKAMFLTKLKIATSVLVVVAAGVGAGLLGHHLLAAEPNAAKAPAPFQQPDENATMNDLKKLQGGWIAVAVEKQGNRLSEDEVKEAELRLIVEGEKFTITSTKGGKEGLKGTLKIDAGKEPRAIDLTAEVAGGRTTTAAGIYELDGDAMKLCYGKERPTEFKTKPEREADQRAYVFRRDKRKGGEK